MSLRKVANQDEAVRLLGEAEPTGLGRAAWARRHGVDPRSLNVWRLNLARRAEARTLPARRPPPLRRGADLFEDHPRVSSGDAQERDGGPIQATPPLLPVPQGVDADPHREGELLLRQPQEGAERRHVGLWLGLPLDQPTPNA
jgi:hypothetical protein